MLLTLAKYHRYLAKITSNFFEPNVAHTGKNNFSKLMLFTLAKKLVLFSNLMLLTLAK